MEFGQTDQVAILKRSQDFVERQMWLFVGQLLRGRVAGVAEGRPRLNFGSFSMPFESAIDMEDGDIATFRVSAFTGSRVTLQFVRREGGSEAQQVGNIASRVKELLGALKLPVDAAHSKAAGDLLKAGYAASRENIQAAVALKADPAGEGPASDVLRGIIHRGGDINPKVLASVREFITSLPSDEALPEAALKAPSAADLLNIAARLGNLRGQDAASVDIQVLARRITEALKPFQAGEPGDVAANYAAAASRRVGVEAAIVRGLQAFIPKYISSLHPDDPLRAIFEQFAAAVKELPGMQAATSATSTSLAPAPLPLEIIPGFIGFLAGDESLINQFEDFIGAFAKYINRILAAPSGDAPSGPDARAIAANAGMNLARLATVVREAMRESGAPVGREQLASILAMAESVGSKAEGMRIAEWLAMPSRPGAENLPVVGFVFEGEGRGTLAMHPGVKRRDDGGEELPAGGRLTYEGEGVGRVEIGLEYGDAGFSALFLVDREDTHNDIQAGLPDLSVKLINRGIRVKSLRSVLRRAVGPEQAEIPKTGGLTGGLDVKA